VACVDQAAQGFELLGQLVDLEVLPSERGSCCSPSVDAS
jgi:hypothetical protein